MGVVRPERTLNPWFQILLGSPFLAGGLFVGWLALSSVLQWQQMKRWPEARAQILEATLKPERDSKGGTIYCVKVHYQYEYEDKTYTGTRVGIDGGADNIGSYHQDMAARLQQAQQTEEKIPCFVNPDHPSEAVLDRSLRILLLVFKTIFGVIFSGVGGLLCGDGLYLLLRRYNCLT